VLPSGENCTDDLGVLGESPLILLGGRGLTSLSTIRELDQEEFLEH
jgi:hypothetical protein